MKNMKKVASLGVAATLVAGGLVVTPAFAQTGAPAPKGEACIQALVDSGKAFTAEELKACELPKNKKPVRPQVNKNGQPFGSANDVDDLLAQLRKGLEGATLPLKMDDGLRKAGLTKAKSDLGMEKNAKFANQGVEPPKGLAGGEKRIDKKDVKKDDKKDVKKDEKRSEMKGGHLAKTGVATGALAGLAGLLGAAGVAAVRRSRRA